MCSRRQHRTFTIPLSPSCRAIVQVETRILRSRCSMPFIGVRPPPPLLCSRRPHRTIIPRSPSCRGRSNMSIFGVGPPPSLSSRRQHRTFFYRSRHRAERSFKSRHALCAHSVLVALVWPVVWRQATAAAVLSPSTLDVYYTALAIVQGDRSSGDAHFALTVLDALHWRQAAAAAAVLSPST